MLASTNVLAALCIASCTRMGILTDFFNKPYGLRTVSTDTTDTQDESAESASPAEATDVSEEQAGADATKGPDTGKTVSEASISEEAAQRIADLEEQLESAQEERDAAKDKFLRKAAELENFRRRMERETRRRYANGQADVIKSILGVLDDMGRTMEAADELKEKQDAETAYESLKGGIEMVHKKFLDDLSGLGVERIDAEGEPFDESLHEAMMQQPAPDDVEPGTVLNEVQAGYRMGDRVIRHSRVIVAT
jgi:molecular chaperone GrpE